MDTAKYFNRIGFHGNPSNDLSSFIKLHEGHINHIPFENLDIHNQTKIQLQKRHLFKKVVVNKRGGFCYELNYLFHLLLTSLGFNSKMISAKIYDDEKLGPEFDHMALLITLKTKTWLADVGFGDLFIKPLQIETTDYQYDGRNYFKIEKSDQNEYVLLMSKNKTDFEKKYVFRIDEKQIEQFFPQCELKQVSNQSYFVKNKIVTMPFFEGRKTLFNSKYSVKNKDNKSEFLINSKQEEARILKAEFNITI